MTGLLKPCARCWLSPCPFVMVIQPEFFLRKLWIHFWLGGCPAKSLTKADSFACDNGSAMSPHHLHQSMRAAFCPLLSSCVKESTICHQFHSTRTTSTFIVHPTF